MRILKVFLLAAAVSAGRNKRGGKGKSVTAHVDPVIAAPVHKPVPVSAGSEAVKPAPVLKLSLGARPPVIRQDPCSAVCIIPGLCGVGGSTCDMDARVCRDLFVTADKVVCSLALSPECPADRPLRCVEAHALFEAKMHPGAMSASAPTGPRDVASPMFARGRRGIENLGNTCYLAAALQMVSHSRHLRAAILAYNPPADMEGLSEMQLQGVLMCLAVKDVLEAQWRSLEAESAIPIDVSDVLAALNEMNEEFEVGKMQDSGEALMMILGTLQDHIGAIAGTLRTGMRSTRTCPSCNGWRVKDENVFSISLPVPEIRDRNVGLHESFATYFNPAPVDAPVECDHGTCVEGVRYPATTTASLAGMPPVLILTLNRFVSEYIPLRGMVSRRINTVINIPPELDMSTLPGGDGTYRLVAIVHHIGASMNVGHYVTDYLHPDDGTYYNANDSRVTPLGGLPRLSSQTAYILMYERV